MRFFYAFVLVLIAGMSYAQNKKLSIIGSSTSACTGPSSFANCYVAKLDAYYDGIAQPIDIFQLAVGGYTVYKGMPSSFIGPWPNLQPDPNNNITKALSFNPDVVLVNYPTNGFDTLRVDSVMRCFRTIRDSANALGKVCFITTTQPRHGFPFNTMAARIKLKELRDSILLQFGYFSIDFWDGLADPVTYEILPAYNSGDNIHLNDAGHDILFQRVRNKNMFAVALPVKLKAFAAKQQQENVSITWTVTDETAGTSYEVQRSQDGLSYQTIQTIDGAGSPASRSYQAIDQSVVSNLYYYRLRINEAGRTFYSQVIKLFTGKNKIAIKSFFTDASRQLVVKLATPEPLRVQFNFMSSAGTIVHKSTRLLQAGDNRISFSFNNLPAGTYWAECVSDDGKIFTKPFQLK
ncbi:MAG: SGNH/GDSL hydrolase family protein [Chitinophagaceae bacterium]